MKKILAFVLIFAVLFSLAACGKSDVLAGDWEGTTESGLAKWTFNDGKCTLSIDIEGFTMDNEGTYEIHEDTGIVVIMLNAWSESKNYQYTINGDTLMLTADDVFSPNYVLTKK